MEARQLAAATVARMTLDEKIGLLSTRQKPIARLGVPAFNIGGEAAHGIVDREHHALTSFPIPLTLAATWDPELATAAGQVVATEARALYNTTGQSAWLMPWAPTIDMERDPRWGRNEEAYGEDPLLAGRVAGGYIDGLQGHDHFLKVAAAPKHFLANNTEAHRGSESNSLTPQMKHEYYLKPFKFAFRDHAAQSMMTAYNGVNGVPMMQSPELRRTVKDAWGMDGCIVTDGGALTLNVEDYHYYDNFRDALADALAKGIDCFVDDAAKVEGAARDALASGQITEAMIDEAITNTLTVRTRLGQLEPTQPFGDWGAEQLGSAEHDAVARRVAAAGTVMLRNDGDTLPLTATDAVLVTGPSADRFVRDWYATRPVNRQTLRAGLAAALGDRADYVDSNDYARLDLSAADPALTADAVTEGVFEVERYQDARVLLRDRATGRYLRLGEDGHLALHQQEVYDWVVREAFILDADGALYALAHDFAASDRNSLQAGGRGLRIGTLTITESGIVRVLAALPGHSKAVVAIGNHPLLIARETEDRTDIALPPAQAELVAAVHDTGVPTATVLLSGYPFAVDQLATDALVTCGYAGQSLGAALADVLTGAVAPTGKLPQTWYKGDWAAPSMREYDIERTARTYQYADPAEVAFPFGYGLTYGHLTVTGAVCHLTGTRALISVDVANRGGQPVTDTVQCYLRSSDLAGRADRRQLIAFQQATVAAGAVCQLTLEAELSDFGWYDAKARRTVLLPGTHQLVVGLNAEDAAVMLPLALPTSAPAHTTLAQPLPARAFDDYRDATLTSLGAQYEVVALAAGGQVTYRHLDVPAGVAVTLVAHSGATLKAASETETATVVVPAATSAQTLAVPLHLDADATLHLSGDAPVTLIALSRAEQKKSH